MAVRALNARAGSWVSRCTFLLPLVASAAAGAQPSPYEVKQLAPGVHVVVRQVPPHGASDSNVLIVVNESDVIVVDANIFPSSARQVIAEIKKLTPKPVRYLINTHWHSDHHYGNQLYREAYPGVEIIAHPATRDLVVREDIPALKRNLETEYPAVIARIRTALATGKRSNGDSLTPESRKELTDALATYEFFLQDMRSTRPVPATMTVADSLVLHRGDRTVVVKYLGRGNTRGDLVVHLPKERIVATGDLVVHPIPFAFSSHLGDWPTTLRALERTGATTIVPGHGAIQTDWTYVDRLIALIESTWDQVRKAVASGADLEATRKAVDVEAFRGAFGGSAPNGRRAFDELFVNPAVEAAYKELQNGRS
jgi:cyclase